MKVIETSVRDILVFEPDFYEDERGHFYESFNEETFKDHLDQKIAFVQENHSFSRANVLRGLHYQIIKSQGKLLRVVNGTIFDVAVDLRKNSPTFKHWIGEIISHENKRSLWIPPGFAHGFFVMSETADVIYKVTEKYFPEHERTLTWDDPTLNINWPVGNTAPILSAKDKIGKTLDHCEVYE